MATDQNPPPAALPHSKDRSDSRAWPALLMLVGLCTAIEAVLSAADAGLIGTPLWRPLAYQYGAFWPGLLHNWTPNFPAQPWTMFLTYSVLHAGPGHLAGNMVTLLSLGSLVAHLAGRSQMLAIYAAATLGGAAAFGLLGHTAQPMVGASGALFGLAGAWQYHDFSDRRDAGHSLWPVVRVVIGLILLNLILWGLMAGRLAWETHFGGFVTGWAVAALLQRWRAR